MGLRTFGLIVVLATKAAKQSRTAQRQNGQDLSGQRGNAKNEGQGSNQNVHPISSPGEAKHGCHGGGRLQPTHCP